MPAPSRIRRVALVQMSCSDRPDENLEKALAGIGEAADRGAHIVCLQELFRSLYFCQEENSANFDLAEPIPGPTSEALGRVARERGVVVVGSVFERRAAGVYHNSAIVLDADGELRGLYRKMHIPDDPLYYEKFYFTPGDLGFRAFQTRYGSIGPLVCWDQWYPEGARLTALRGAELLVYPTAIGWHPSEKSEWGERQRDAWRLIQRSHAIANGVFVAAVNRVGRETPLAASEDRPLSYQGLEFWGQSFVAGPLGELLVEGGDSDEIVVADCDFARIEQTRRNWPFLRDRRIDAYEGVTRRYLEERA